MSPSDTSTCIKEWAFSAGGLPLELHQSANLQHVQSRPLLIIGGVHGDEPEGVWLAEHVLEWLQRTPVQIPWLLIPCLNPDGYAARQRVNGNGVDLNRNFPCQNWSPAFEKERYFPGSRPNSEPETQALVKLISDVQPRLIIHCHSWIPCIVYTGDPGRPAAEALARSSGYPAQPDIGYPTPGSLGEYGWRERQTPVICIEEAERVEKATVWPRFQSGFRELFEGAALP